MKRKLWSAVFCAVVVGSLFAVEIREQKVGGETSRWFEEMVPQADGVRIYTYGSVPAPGVKCPIIIQRNPYVKEERVDMPSFARGQLGTLARGYARVFQHCRGSGVSEGVRIPYENERADGLALLDYARKLPWYNGEIYLEGGSYLTSVHWAYLDTNPADVKGAFLAIQEVDRYNVCYRNGFFKIGLHGGWFIKEHHKTDHALTRNREVSFRDFPLQDFSMRYWGRPEPAFDNVLTHPDRDDPFWKSNLPGSGAEARNALMKSTMPVLLKTAFYDIYTEGLCDMWRELPAARRANCALLIDAYDHGGKLNEKLKGTLGEFPRGARADENVSALDWFDSIRKGVPCPGAERNRTKYYALWENVWHVEPSLVDGPRKVSLKLGDDTRSYTYDPKLPPPPFPGSGGICFGGMQVQPTLDGRTDAVSFLLPPVSEQLDVRGRMELDLAVASDCEDTCFYVRVSVDKGDDRFYLLRDEITSLSHATAHPDIQTSRHANIHFRFPDHAFRLRKGDVLRVDVASAHPQFAPHTNVKGKQFAIREPKIAHNTVFAADSRLVLHVLPPSSPVVTVGADVELREEMVPMRDGVRLYTRTLLPKDGGKVPVVFVRTPYAKTDGVFSHVAEKVKGDDYSKRGYAHVTQHCRGSGASEGLCRPYIEREDGLDTLEWIRKQSWYNGEIFLEGGSYLASVHLTYLSADPPDIKGAAFSIQTDRMQPRQYRNGCNYNWCNYGWWWGMIRREFPNPSRDCVRRPYKDNFRRAFGNDDPRYTGMLSHTKADEFWTSDPRWNVMSHIKFPVLWTEGWWDFYIEGMVSMWERMRPDARAKSVFVMKPMAHGGHPLKGTPIPETKYECGLGTLDFFDAIRAGRSDPRFPYGQMTYHSVGADAWRTTTWPKQARSTRVFALDPSGSLIDDMMTRRGEVSWVYDPRGPRIPGLAEGKCQQSWAPKSRKDAVEFVSKPFEKETSFFGKPRVTVPVKSDCDDTQVFFRIDLVDPEGKAWNVCQTISTLRHANPNCKAGDTVDLDLDFPLTGFTVKKGWGVRLDVCSDGGVYVQQANRAKHWAEVTEREVRVAHNTLLCGMATLELPLE